MWLQKSSALNQHGRTLNKTTCRHILWDPNLGISTALLISAVYKHRDCIRMALTAALETLRLAYWWSNSIQWKTLSLDSLHRRNHSYFNTKDHTSGCQEAVEIWRGLTAATCNYYKLCSNYCSEGRGRSFSSQIMSSKWRVASDLCCRDNFHLAWLHPSQGITPGKRLGPGQLLLTFQPSQ